MLSSCIPTKIDWTNVEDLKDPDEVLLPSGDLVLIVLCKDETEDRPPFTPLGDPPLNLGQGPTIEISVSGSLDACIAGLAHAVRVPIALRTCWLRSPDPLPFNL